MPQDCRPDLEQAAALILEQRLHEAGGVDRAGGLVADQQPEPLAAAEALDQVRQVALQVVQRDALLVQVHALGASGQAAHQRQVAALAAHHLDDEAAA